MVLNMPNVVKLQSIATAVVYRCVISCCPVCGCQLDDMEWYLEYAAERPWVYLLIVLGIGVPACLLLSCCLPESVSTARPVPSSVSSAASPGA